MIIDEFWQEFLDVNDKDSNTQYFECFYFGSTESLANELLKLVLLEIKQATASSLLYYNVKNSRAPQVGDYSIVTDWKGIPYCIIETTAITILPFKEITYEICKREGEDDTLESWQKGHRKFFIEEGKELGYQFSDDMPVVFEDFKVVYKK